MDSENKANTSLMADTSLATNSSGDYMTAQLDRYLQNRSMNNSYFIILVFGYTVLAISGFLGNTLVCSVVIWKPYMRTVRNMLILNLAISDMLLCLFTMPLSLVQIVTTFWTFGELMCKCVAGFQATSVFVSTLSITAIAIDRYKVIVHPTNKNNNMFGVLAAIFFIWQISLLLATPLFVYRAVTKYSLNLSELPSVSFCSEQWPIDSGAIIYSISTIIFQYIFPIVAVSFTHALICMKLEYRLVRKRTMTNLRGRRKDESRRRRTNNLLFAIACVFAVTWLPLNVINLLTDFGVVSNDRESFNLIFGLCHMFGMTSACSNPILYGWFNENFRKEFKNLLKIIFTRYENDNEYQDTGNNGEGMHSETGNKITYLQSEL